MTYLNILRMNAKFIVKRPLTLPLKAASCHPMIKTSQFTPRINTDTDEIEVAGGYTKV